MKTKKSLFDIGEDIELLEESLSAIEDDSEMQEVVLGFLEDATQELSQKVDNYLSLIREKQAIAAARKDEAKRLNALAKSDENLARNLKNTLQYFFESRGISKMETPRYRVSIARNGGKKPIVLNQLIEAKDLPERFQRVEVTPNMDAIREALENGEDLGFAEFDQSGTSLRIK